MFRGFIEIITEKFYKNKGEEISRKIHNFPKNFLKK